MVFHPPPTRGSSNKGSARIVQTPSTTIGWLASFFDNMDAFVSTFASTFQSFEDILRDLENLFNVGKSSNDDADDDPILEFKDNAQDILDVAGVYNYENLTNDELQERLQNDPSSDFHKLCTDFLEVIEDWEGVGKSFMKLSDEHKISNGKLTSIVDSIQTISEKYAHFLFAFWTQSPTSSRLLTNISCISQVSCWPRKF